MTVDYRTALQEHAARRGLKDDALEKVVHEYFVRAFQGEFRDFGEFFKKTKPSLEVTIEEMNEVFEEMHTKMRIDERMVEVIVALKKQYKIALLTNFTSNLEQVLKDVFDIYHLFDVIANSYEMKTAKPEAAAYHYPLKELGMEPEETVFIDDKVENIEGAEALGIKGILYENFEQCRADLEKVLGHAIETKPA